MATGARIILDSGAPTMLAENDPGLRQYVFRELAAGAYLVIPSSVVAESTTGTARDATVDDLRALAAERASTRVIDARHTAKP